MNKERLGIWNENLSEIDERRELIELIQERIHIAKLELVDLNLHEAKRVYAEIMDLYNHLDSNDKSKVYQDIKDLYYNRKRAERVHKNKLAIYGIPIILSLFIISILFISKPEITGYIVLEQEKMFGDNLNLIINESGSYIWQLKNPGDLKSIKLSGALEKRGSAKVYVEHKDKRYLILDSNKLVESDVLNKITGFVVAQGKESTQSNSSPIRNSDAERLGVNEMTDITSIKDIITDKSITEGTINETPILNKTLEKRIINKTDEAINQTLILNEKINEFNNNLTIKNDSILENNNPINDNLNNEVINNISFNNQTINKSIEISLEYKSGTDYDADDDGVEYTTGIIDLTVENTNFNWDVDESNLCARWETYSVENEESTFVCYGSSRCCQFVDLLAAKPAWDEPFYSVYGQYGATFNNIVSAQVLYVDYGLSVDEPYAEIYNSEWADLSASYFAAFTEFEDICVETCILFGFNETSYKLIFEINNTILKLDLVNYKILEAIDKVQVNIDIVDSNGFDSGAYNLYKDNVSVTVIDKFVEPDYYDLEIIPKENIINKITIKNVNITSPLIAAIGVDKVSREQEIKNLEIKKQYAVDVSEVDFETATLNAVAEANSLFKCKQWDYVTEVCYGTWEKIKDLAVGKEYSLTITADDPGFVEGNSEIEIINITPINISELTLIKNISNITIIKNNNISIDLNDYFLNLDNSTIFTYFDIENVDIIFDTNIATIVPDKDFVGKRFTFITANKSNKLIPSNIFSVNIINITLNITPKIIPEKKDFKFDEDIKMDFEYLGKKELIKQGKWKEEYEVYEKETDKTEQEFRLLREKIIRKEKQIKKWESDSETIQALIYDYNNNLVDIDVEIEELREGKFKIKLQTKRAFRAGKYTLKLDLIKDGTTYTQEQDFTWGVLAINVNKSIYLPNEDSFIGIAVLDDQGHMVCDADVTLTLINPNNEKTIFKTNNDDNDNISNNNSNNKLNNKNIIKVSPECEVYGVTNLPDYYTNYSVSGVGTYVMNLTAATFNGVRSILDNFSAQSSVDYDVARDGPTRIYPFAPYVMNISIIANKNYNGVINEYVPSSFNIIQVEIYEVSESGITLASIIDLDDKVSEASKITSFAAKEIDNSINENKPLKIDENNNKNNLNENIKLKNSGINLKNNIADFFALMPSAQAQQHNNQNHKPSSLINSEVEYILTRDCFFSSLSSDQIPQWYLSAAAKYCTSSGSGLNKSASFRKGFSSDLGTTSILSSITSKNLVKSSEDLWVFNNNSSLCSLNSERINSGVINSTLSETSISAFLPSLIAAENNSLASAINSIHINSLYLLDTALLTFPPSSNASCSVSSLSDAKYFKKINSFAFLDIASLATLDQSMPLNLSITSLTSSGTDIDTFGILSSPNKNNENTYLKLSNRQLKNNNQNTTINEINLKNNIKINNNNKKGR